MAKSMTAKIRYLKHELVMAESTISQLKEERDEFRSHFAQRFRWWLKLLGENGGPSLSWLIEADSKFLQKVKSWYW